MFHEDIQILDLVQLNAELCQALQLLIVIQHGPPMVTVMATPITIPENLLYQESGVILLHVIQRFNEK
jgi:hypothetical protein